MSRLQFDIDFLIGLSGLVIGSLILFVWIPLDIDSGLAEKVRGRLAIGDALAPTVAASVLIIGSLLTMLQAFRKRSKIKLTWDGLKFSLFLVSLLGISLLLMRWSGPFLASIVGLEYRILRDTIPWKYIGFFLGGGFMVFSLISLMEGRMRWRSLIVAVLTVVVLMLMYDLPFEDLLLPPNGDL